MEQSDDNSSSHVIIGNVEDDQMHHIDGDPSTYSLLDKGVEESILQQ